MSGWVQAFLGKGSCEGLSSMAAVLDVSCALEEWRQKEIDVIFVQRRFGIYPLIHIDDTASEAYYSIYQSNTSLAYSLHKD
jgi:hypothetical protein